MWIHNWIEIFGVDDLPDLPACLKCQLIFTFQYKKKSIHVVERLKDKVEILEAKNVEIELEKKALQ